jgi:hypothetical protein
VHQSSVKAKLEICKGLAVGALGVFLHPLLTLNIIHYFCVQRTKIHARHVRKDASV